MLFMNRLVLLSVFTIVVCTDLFAQDLSYGVKAGMNLSNFFSDDSSDVIIQFLSFFINTIGSCNAF